MRLPALDQCTPYFDQPGNSGRCGMRAIRALKNIPTRHSQGSDRKLSSHSHPSASSTSSHCPCPLSSYFFLNLFHKCFFFSQLSSLSQSWPDAINFLRDSLNSFKKNHLEPSYFLKGLFSLLKSPEVVVLI